MFIDRVDAGKRLAERLGSQFVGEDVVVLGLPRGGVPVALEVARALDAPLDVIVVRKLGVPFQPELAMGAIGEDVLVLNPDVVRVCHIGTDELRAVEAAERVELERRVERFRRDHPRVPLEGRTAVVVDDGIATGATARAACQVAKANGAARVVLAVPVAPPDTVRLLRTVADAVVCVNTPTRLSGVGAWYRDFRQVSDDEVVALLRRARERSQHGALADSAADRPERDSDVEITAGAVRLAGHLTLPARPQGVVVFAHGSGSSRHSPRNRHVARGLNEAGLGTLLFDLLTPVEETDRSMVFDIGLLAQRLVQVTHWLQGRPECAGLRIGYFGASTGAGAALWAAADPSVEVHAVVSRGGRPDLAAPRLPAVHTPTLLIVGAHDRVVLQLNREAQAMLRCESELAVVPGATHLFEEPGTLDHAARLARDWFLRHLAPQPARSR